ncbi:ABC transporter permease subunit [Tautonia sociabilis]|uniref:ABC transporter permease n=1 Tax=Tautonia sociabilis TaxID=2080755 RepID=A0A432MMF4_9BACT|nr:ABC transporter permease subunit [Tautonia sociabilis]RUL88602.1 ABC transporter permease [Tautonia sociabilis]
MKTLTIARATATQAIRQPAFVVLLFFASMVLITSVFLPYFTFGEDIKMYKDTGLTAITFFALLLALLTSSSAVAEEIEGKTAVTLLSKPVNRRQFIVGKFMGIEAAVLALFLILGALFAAGVWYKYVYDLREGAGGTIDTAMRVKQVLQVMPGLALGFFEVTVIAAISVAISTRLPMLVNLITCISIFFLGHLTEVLVRQAEDIRANELVTFMARLFQWALPFLEFFNAGPAISTGVIIPWVGYVLPALVYCVLYSGAALLFAFLLFETRDVA